MRKSVALSVNLPAIPAQRGPAGHRAFTVDQVIDLPLDELLPPLDAEIVDVDVNEPGFYGQLVEKRSGHMILAMPSRQSSIVRDVAARMLIATALGMELAQFPSALQTTVVRENGQDVL